MTFSVTVIFVADTTHVARVPMIHCTHAAVHTKCVTQAGSPLEAEPTHSVGFS